MIDFNEVKYNQEKLIFVTFLELIQDLLINLSIHCHSSLHETKYKCFF